MNIIILILAIIFLILSINASYIFIKNIESKRPKWMSYNWIFVFLLYGTIVCLGYFLKFILHLLK